MVVTTGDHEGHSLAELVADAVLGEGHLAHGVVTVGGCPGSRMEGSHSPVECATLEMWWAGKPSRGFKSHSFRNWHLRCHFGDSSRQLATATVLKTAWVTIPVGVRPSQSPHLPSWCNW